MQVKGLLPISLSAEMSVMSERQRDSLYIVNPNIRGNEKCHLFCSVKEILGKIGGAPPQHIHFCLLCHSKARWLISIALGLSTMVEIT